MDNLVSTVGSGEISCYVPTSPPPSKLQTYVFAIVIIVGIGGLAGNFEGEATSNIAQVDAIIMMAAGGRGGIILLIVGIVSTIKNRKSSSQLHDGVHVDAEHSSAIHTSDSIGRADVIR